MPAKCKDISTVDLPIPGGVVFGEFTYPAGGRFGPRTQRDVQLVMLDSGSLLLNTDGQDVAVSPGEVVCQWPGGREMYTFDSRSPSTHRWVSLSFDGRPGTTRRVGRLRSGAPALRTESPAMRAIFAAGFRRGPLRSMSADAALRHLGLAYLAAYLLLADAPRGRDRRPLPTPLLAMQTLIAERFAEPLTLDALAAAASVTPNHLVRLCRKQLGTTPIRLLWDTRTRQGVALLRDTGLSVSEVAYRVGFANPFHFSRAVKAQTGKSPTQLREAAWQGMDR